MLKAKQFLWDYEINGILCNVTQTNEKNFQQRAVVYKRINQLAAYSVYCSHLTV